jgi:hypothetical protein
MLGNQIEIPHTGVSNVLEYIELILNYIFSTHEVVVVLTPTALRYRSVF